MEVSLAEAAFGVSRELKVDTAVLCTTCQGEGTAPGTHPVPCETCRGAGEVAHVQRSFLGEIRTLRPCAACRGYGTLIPDPCRECSGDGRVRARRSLTVKIPAGVDTGTRVQLAGQGEVGPGGGPAGDLYVEVHVTQHPVFTREGTTLHCTVTVPMTAAALGTTLTLPTLEADVEQGAGSGVETEFELEVRAGSQSGSDHTLRGRGVPGLRGGRGDLVVTVVVETPRRSCCASWRRSGARRSPTAGSHREAARPACSVASATRSKSTEEGRRRWAPTGEPAGPLGAVAGRHPAR
jgi:molecular chaperone DnaJ